MLALQPVKIPPGKTQIVRYRSEVLEQPGTPLRPAQLAGGFPTEEGGGGGFLKGASILPGSPGEAARRVGWGWLDDSLCMRVCMFSLKGPTPPLSCFQ